MPQPRPAKLDNLTPGDFHAVLRARRLAQDPITTRSILTKLQEECIITHRRGD
jgi:hypothetical protein